MVSACFVPVPCRADSPETVLVVHFKRSELATQLSAELASQGFFPKLIELPEPLEMEGIRTLAASEGATAVLQIAPTEIRVSVWVSGRNDDLGLMQEVSAPGDREDAVTLAVFKSVELLRASLLVLPKRSKSALPSVGVAPQARLSEVRRPAGVFQSGRLFLDVEPALTYGFGETVPLLHIGAALRLAIWKRLHGTLFGLMPTVPLRVVEPEGTVEIRSGLIALGMAVDLLPPEGAVALTLGAGAGPLMMKMQGSAAEPYVSKSAFVTVVLPYLCTGLSLAITDGLGFRADLLAGWPPQKPVVKMLDRNVTDWARPLVSLLIGLEVRLF